LPLPVVKGADPKQHQTWLLRDILFTEQFYTAILQKPGQCSRMV